MKKYLFTAAFTALLLSTASCGIISKSPAESLKEALAQSKNPVNANNPKVWYDLGEAYLQAYNATNSGLWANMSKKEATLVFQGQKPLKSETIEINGVKLNKQSYKDKILYFNPQDKLVSIISLNQIDSLALSKSAKDFLKAYNLDKSYKEKVVKHLQEVANKMSQEAFSQFNLGRMLRASDYFSEAADIMQNPPVSKVDSNCLFNAGFTAAAAHDNARALKYFKKCMAIGYDMKGELYPRLALVDTLHANDILEKGFLKYPTNQQIIIALVNLNVKDMKGNHDRLFKLLDIAKKNDPKNASLYYVEGNVLAQLGQVDKACQAYDEASKLDPTYIYGYVGKGQMFYNNAIKIQEAAQNEVNDAKYKELNAKFEATLKACLEPFEKAYDLAKDAKVKQTIAQYLKNAYFRFRDQDPKYKAAFEKYDKICDQAK